jgi:prophage DNA circulation protein
MNWQSRLRAQVTLTPPQGPAFTANWRANDIEGTKLIGEFTYPLDVGTVAQDLGAAGRRFPLTLIFEGDDHDLTAWNFQLAFLSQTGTWTVVHPVYGSLTLQGLTITLKADPTESANETVVETTWLEPKLAQALASTGELASSIQSQAADANAASASALEAGINAADPSQISAAISQGQNGLSAFSISSLAALAGQAADVWNAVFTAYDTAQSALYATPMDLATFISQFQTMLALPGTIVIDLTSKITAFTALATTLIAQIAGGSDATAVAAGYTSEAMLTASLVAACEAVAMTQPATRDEAVQAIATLNAMFSALTAGLDVVMLATLGNAINGQYFSQTNTYTSLARLLGTTVQYLLSIIFDLKIAKRFTLKTNRAPIEIVITEYGAEYDSAGNSLLDQFIAANALIGYDVLLLRPGREVVVYV